MELSLGIWPNDPYALGIVGVATNSWGDKPVEWCIEKAVEYGYEAVDFIDKKFFELSPDQYEKTLNTLADFMAEKGVIASSVGAHHLALVPRNYERRAKIDLVKKSIDLTAQIKAKTIVCYIDGYYNPPTYILLSRSTAKQIFIDMVKECAEYAGEKGLTLSIEPHQETLINLPDITLELIEYIGLPNIRITVDFGGLYLGIKPHMPVIDAIKKMGHLINHVHAKDISGTIGRWNMCWFGGGIVNFKEVAEALNAINYQGYIGVEWEGWFKGGLEGVGDLSQSGLSDFDRVAPEAKEFLEQYFK